MAYVYLFLYERVMDILASDPRVPLSAISEKLSVERHTLEKAIRATTGRSFRELRRELTLSRTRDLLALEAAKSIKEISFLLGYRSPQAFARFVKKACGCSPAELRRAVLGSRPRPLISTDKRNT